MQVTPPLPPPLGKLPGGNNIHAVVGGQDVDVNSPTGGQTSVVEFSPVRRQRVCAQWVVGRYGRFRCKRWEWSK